MSASTSPPPAPEEQHEFLPTPGSSSDEEDDDDDDIISDLVTATHLQAYGDHQVPRRPFAAAPRAVLVPWLGLGRGRGGAAPAPAPAPAASIDAVPTVEVSEPGAVCAICKDDLPVAAAARRLPCGHLYHSTCIVPWLEVHNSCPICRARLPSNPEPRREVVVVVVQSSSEQEPPPPPTAGGSV
jgi:hypothetical protein